MNKKIDKFTKYFFLDKQKNYNQAICIFIYKIKSRIMKKKIN
jgi:hypothetical protein